MNECKDCGATKAWSEFPKNKTYTSGHSNQCKECRSAYHRSHYEAHRDLYLGRASARYRADPETAKAYAAARYQANRDSLLEQGKRYYEANREAHAEMNRRWVQANPERVRAIKRRHRVRRAGWEWVAMTAEDREVSAAYRKAISGDSCTYCDSLGEHDDHVMPLSRGGTDHWWNLTRACAPCNISKGAKTLEEWKGLARARS